MAQDLGRRLEQLDKEIAGLSQEIKEAGSEYRKAPSGSEIEAKWKLEQDRLVADRKELLRQREGLQAKLAGNEANNWQLGPHNMCTITAAPIRIVLHQPEFGGLQFQRPYAVGTKSALPAKWLQLLLRE